MNGKTSLPSLGVCNRLLDRAKCACWLEVPYAILAFLNAVPIHEGREMMLVVRSSRTSLPGATKSIDSTTSQDDPFSLPARRRAVCLQCSATSVLCTLGRVPSQHISFRLDKEHAIAKAQGTSPRSLVGPWSRQSVSQAAWRRGQPANHATPRVLAHTLVLYAVSLSTRDPSSLIGSQC